MNWLKWLWNVATRVVLPAVTAVQRVVQQREAASKQKPEPKAANAANGVNNPKPAAPSPQPPPIPQRRTAPPDRDIAPRIGPTPAPVITPGQQLALQELLERPRNRGLHLLVEPDAEIVLKVAHRIPGILETAVQNLGSFKAAFDYLLANGVSLSEEEIGALLQQFHPSKLRMRGETDEQTQWLAFPAGSQERRECELAYINAFVDGTRTYPNGNPVDPVFTAKLWNEAAWSDTFLDLYYTALAASRDYCSAILPQEVYVGDKLESGPFNPPYDLECTERMPDDVCVSLPMGTFAALNWIDFKHPWSEQSGYRNSVPRAVDEMRRFLITNYGQTSDISFTDASTIPAQWEGVLPGSLVLYRTDEPEYKPYSHVSLGVGYGPPKEVWLERLRHGQSVFIAQTFEEAQEYTRLNGWPDPVLYVIDRGRMGEAGGIDNRGPHPYDWNWTSLDQREPMYSVTEYQVMMIQYSVP